MILTVLKVIGVVILVILCLLIFILGVLLFVPVQYRFAGSYRDDIQGEAVVNWNPLLLKATVTFREKKPEYIVKLLGGVVMTNTDRKLSWIGRRFFAFDKEVEEVEAKQKKTSGKKSKTKITGVVLDDTIEGLDDIPYQEKANVIGDKVIGTASDEQKTNPKEKRKKEKIKKESIWKRLKDMLSNIQDKIRLWRDKLREINQKKEDLLRVYHSKRFDVAKQDVMLYIKTLWAVIKPKRLEGYVHFGLEDPANTGQVLGVLAMALPLYDDFLIIRPDFEQACMEGNLEGNGKIRLFPVARLVLKVIFNKNLIKVTKKVQTIIEA